jgi:hypothetical protein
VLGEQTLWVLRAEIGGGRYRGAVSRLLLGALLAGCAIEAPDYGTLPNGPDAPTQNLPPVQTVPPARSHADAGDSVDVDAGTRTSVPMESLGNCTDGETKACGPETVGTCHVGTRNCVQGQWSECEGAVMPGTRDCGSPLDNDCDGQPDNEDANCRCEADAKEACETHGEFDGIGPCRAGERKCVLSSDRQRSDWGPCTGAVAPLVKDSCIVLGDDSNCNGTPNGDCTCVEGAVVACGPPADVGICRRGTSTCVNGKPGDCLHPVYKQARDCTSPNDNDCNGQADNLETAFCKCEIGKKQDCGTHPQDGTGQCTQGSQLCIAGPNNTTSAFGDCLGSVGPVARDCTSPKDNDCNGTPDNTLDTICACTIGVVSNCLTHPGLDNVGICRAGQALCIAGPGNSSSSLGTCSGSVGPLPADSCTVAGDDSNCNGTMNDACECIVNTSCTDPGNSRCSAGKCLGCTSNAECTHIPGFPVCNFSVCVQCTTASPAACGTGLVCDDTTHTCVAAPPPPVTPDPPVTP